jgi:hypothetical protein
MALVMSLTVSCVGPSRTIEDYRRKVAQSAEVVLSAVESARLTVQVAEDGRAPGPYVSLRLSESEETVSSVETALGAVQPPDPELDALRRKTLSEIGHVSEVLEELRLAAYRGRLRGLSEIAAGLDAPASELRGLMELESV